MNRIKHILIFFILTNVIYAQDVKMTTEYSSDNEEMSNLLQFENIDLYNVKFVGKDISTKNYVLVAKEMWNGQLKRIDTVINTSKYPKISKIKTDTLKLKVLAKRTAEPKLKLWFHFPKYKLSKKYEAVMSDDYSLRDIGVEETIEYGKDFYAFAYIMPYEKNGYKFWCTIEDNGADIEKWGEEFGIKHYILYQMKFSE